MKKALIFFSIFIAAFAFQRHNAECPECTRCKGNKTITVKCPPKLFDCEPGIFTCPRCDGTGTYCPPPQPPPPPPPDLCECKKCKGDGIIIKPCRVCEDVLEINCITCGGDGRTCE